MLLAAIDEVEAEGGQPDVDPAVLVLGAFVAFHTHADVNTTVGFQRGTSPKPKRKRPRVTHYAKSKHTTACGTWFSEGIPCRVTRVGTQITCYRCKVDIAERIAKDLSP
jgi:hypothetical protein